MANGNSWNRLMQWVGNILQWPQSVINNTFTHKDEMYTDEEIHSMMNKIRKVYSDLRAKDQSKLDELIEKLSSLNTRLGSPDLNSFIQAERRKLKQSIDTQAKKVADYDVYNAALEEMNADLLNESPEEKNRNHTTYQKFKELSDQADQGKNNQFNNYEEKIN